MKIKMMKVLAVGFVSILMSASGIAVFANPTNIKVGEKTSVIARKHPKTVRVAVTKDGFSPSEIKVEKGYELTMIFTRASGKSCGSKVTFPSLNISQKLPVGKEVTVKITPDKAGEIAFTCGKMKGTILAR